VTNHLVDGVPLPDHVAGHLALELCNTKALWGLSSERDYFSSYAVAVLWAREHGVIDADEVRRLRGEPAPAQRVALGRLRRLRAGLFHSVTTAGAVQDEALAEVHGFVARAVARSSYARSGVLQAAWSSAVITDRCALAAHELLTRYGTGAVGLCAGKECGWVFLDPSRRRRWCTMAVCGNRAKARRFAERRRG